MSAESIKPDHTKHVYHSIPMDVPGAVTMTDRSRFCGGSRKAMTLILASALLWVIVLDIMLVAYKSRHVGSAAHKEQLAGSVLVLAGPLGPPAPSVDERNNSSLHRPPAGNVTATTAGVGDVITAGAGEAPGQKAELARRSAGGGLSGRSGPALPGLQGWLSRLRHRPQMTPLDHRDETVRFHRPLFHPRLPPSGHPFFWPPPHPRNMGNVVSFPGLSRPGPGLRYPDMKPHLGPRNAETKPSPGPRAEETKPGPGPWAVETKQPGGQGPQPADKGPAPGPRGADKGPGPGPRGADKGPDDDSSEAAFLVRFFSAIVDAPWNLTSTAGGGGRRRPPPPVPSPGLSPPPPPPPPPPMAFGHPFLPGPFMSLLSHDPNLGSDDDDDPDEAIFDIDISE